MARAKQGVAHQEPLEGEQPDKPGQGENYAQIDDVLGCSKGSMPDDVKGHAGNLMSAEETKNL